MFTLLRLAAISVALLSSVPTMAAEYQVNTTTDVDDGVCDANNCSLREAWNAANATADEIKFNTCAPANCKGAHVVEHVLSSTAQTTSHWRSHDAGSCRSIDQHPTPLPH